MMGCGAGARLLWVGEHSAWEKRGRGSLGKDLEGARVQDLPDRLGQPHCSGSTEVPGVAALMGVPQQVLSLPETWQGGLGHRDVSGSWSWFSHQGTRKGLGILDHSSASPFPVVTPSPGSLASRDSTLAHREHTA